MYFKYFINLMLLNILLFLPFDSNAQEIRNNCIECHSKLQGEMSEPVHLFQNDVHKIQGLMCQDCHGGNATIKTNGDQKKAKGPGTGFIGKPSRSSIPKLCSRCHSDPSYMHKFNPNIRVDQYMNYLTSVHGSRWSKGDTKVAVCTSCHHVHQIRRVNDTQSSIYPANIQATCSACHSTSEYMAEYKIPTDQEINYKKSVHADYLYKKGDLSAPTCVSCHGNHGAAPPGVKSVIFVCGVCHPSQEQYFSVSTHKEYFDSFKEPGCITCHGNHAIMPANENMIQVKEKDYFCGKCHSEGDDEETIILQIRGTIDSLKNAYHSADSILQTCAVKGIEISEAQYQLSQIYTGITETRNGVHSFSIEKIREMAKPNFSAIARINEKGSEGLREVNIRRTYLLVTLAAIVFLIIALLLLIRQREKS